MEHDYHKDNYHASFKDTLWLQSFPLTYQTVIHYFSISSFYDRTCNNERLKMQRLEPDRLKTMRGIEYEVLPPLPPHHPTVSLFIIRKQRRSSANQVKPMAFYYVLDGTIYQAPNLYAILSSRLKKASFRVNQAFHGLASSVQYEPTDGYIWNFSQALTGADDEHEKNGRKSSTSPKPIPSEQMAKRLRKLADEYELKKKNGARIEKILLGLVKKHIPDVAQAGENLKKREANEAALGSSSTTSKFKKQKLN